MWRQKTGITDLPYGEEIMIVGRTMLAQCTSVSDRRTDRQTDRFTVSKTALSIASRGKNGCIDSFTSGSFFIAT